MTTEPTIRFHNQEECDLLDACELSAEERSEFDYLNWADLDAGRDSATFFRYRGTTFDLGEFMVATGDELSTWGAYAADSFFSGHVIRLTDDDGVICALYLA